MTDAGTAVAEPPAPEAGAPAAQTKRPLSRELPLLVLAVLIIVLVSRAFLVQAFYIPSGSMEKTLHGCDGCHGDRVLVNRLVYRVRDIHRGEIVVFDGKNTSFPPDTDYRPPANAVQSGLRSVQRALGLGAPGQKDFIKRVIGLPGDEISCCVDGKVVVNGEPLDEPYLFEDNHQPFCSGGRGNVTPATDTQCAEGSTPFVVPPGMVFVMGDHRGASSDSRAHGPIPESAIIGRAFVRIWPLKRLGVLEVPDTFNAQAAPPGHLRRLGWRSYD